MLFIDHRMVPRLALPVLFLMAAMIGRAFPISITDDNGKKITLAAKPARIVSLTPSNTEILFALGLGKEIVGVTNYCDFPPAAKAIAKVGDLNLNYEKIVVLRPDLVLAVGGMQSGAIERLGALGLKVMVLNPGDLASTMAAIEKVGRATGRGHAAHRLVDGMKKRVNAVTRRFNGLPERDRPRVYVEIWANPLMTAGPGTFTAELIRLAGGKDIARDAKPWSLFSEELILTRDPQVIVSQCNSADAIRKRPGWGSLDAVRNGRIHNVDQNIFSRPGPRLVDALEILAGLLHPEKTDDR